MAHSAYTEVASPAVAPAKNADWMNAHYARFQSPYAAQDKPSLKTSQIQIRKECDNMIKINYMSTLFVGIDVSSKSNVVCAMDFDENQYISSSFKNNQPGADELAKMILECMKIHSNLNTIVVAL